MQAFPTTFYSIFFITCQAAPSCLSCKAAINSASSSKTTTRESSTAISQHAFHPPPPFFYLLESMAGLLQTIKPSSKRKKTSFWAGTAPSAEEMLCNGKANSQLMRGPSDRSQSHPLYLVDIEIYTLLLLSLSSHHLVCSHPILLPLSFISSHLTNSGNRAAFPSVLGEISRRDPSSRRTNVEKERRQKLPAQILRYSADVARSE